MPQASKIWTLSDDPNYIKFWAFWQKSRRLFLTKCRLHFGRSFCSWNNYCLMLNYILIKRPPSFSVPKITVVRPGNQVKSCSKHCRHQQSYGKSLVPLKVIFSQATVFRPLSEDNWGICKGSKLFIRCLRIW